MTADRPHNFEAEEAVLGAALRSGRAYTYAVEAGVTGGSFYNRAAHASVWSVVVDLEGAGVRADVQATTAALRAVGLLEQVGGPQSVLRLAIGGPVGIERRAVAYQAGLVVAAALRRQLIEVGAEMVKLGHSIPAGPATALEHAQQLVDEAGRLLSGLRPGVQEGTA